MTDKTTPTQDTNAASNDVAATVQKHVGDFKTDLLNRLNGIKEQLPLSSKDLAQLKEMLQAEFTQVLNELGQISKEIKQDLSEISTKHKDQLVDVLQRSKDNAVEALKSNSKPSSDETDSKAEDKAAPAKDSAAEDKTAEKTDDKAADKTDSKKGKKADNA